MLKRRRAAWELCGLVFGALLVPPCVHAVCRMVGEKRPLTGTTVHRCRGPQGRVWGSPPFPLCRG